MDFLGLTLLNYAHAVHRHVLHTIAPFPLYTELLSEPGYPLNAESMAPEEPFGGLGAGIQSSSSGRSFIDQAIDLSRALVPTYHTRCNPTDPRCSITSKGL